MVVSEACHEPAVAPALEVDDVAQGFKGAGGAEGSPSTVTAREAA